MMDNVFFSLLVIAITICFIATLIFSYNVSYNEKIVPIKRYEYVIKLPDNRIIQYNRNEICEK
jgi:hypothetical protein